MASRACCNKDEPLLVDTINEEPIGFDMAFAMSSIRSAQGMVAPPPREGLPFVGAPRGSSRVLRDFLRLFGGQCGLTPRRIASQQCTQMPQNGSERPFSPICVHSCVPAPAHNVATVYTNAPKRRREAIFADLCTLLRHHGCSRDRAGPQVPRHRRPHGPRDARALGPEAHAARAVTQPPTHTNSRSLPEIGAGSKMFPM